MLDTVKRTISAYHMLEPGENVLVALSGGADSVALTLALCRLRDTAGWAICAAHVNHGLRGAESDGDQAFVEALEADCAVRPSAFDASFSREQLAAFVLDSLLGQMSRGADNCEGLEQVLRRLLYC